MSRTSKTSKSGKRFIKSIQTGIAEVRESRIVKALAFVLNLLLEEDFSGEPGRWYSM